MALGVAHKMEILVPLVIDPEDGAKAGVAACADE